MQAVYGLDGWHMAYCIDSAVLFVGSRIEGMLYETIEKGKHKGQRRYKDIQAVFRELEGRKAQQAQMQALANAQERLSADDQPAPKRTGINPLLISTTKPQVRKRSRNR